MHAEWNLHYARWVIEDGQPKRSVGDVFDWSDVEFNTEGALAAAREQAKMALPVGDYVYRVVAEVTYLSGPACVIDFGLKATSFSDLLPQECVQGDYVTGEIYLSLGLNTHVLPEQEVFNTLAYRWHVNRISADLTPYNIPHPVYSGGFIRNASQVSYQDVQDTDSINARAYILHCSEVGT
jgi:hypothetical protein